jgi:hypothetical protein
MTARDDLLTELHRIAPPYGAHLVSYVFEDFPTVPEFSRAQRTDEAALNDRIAKCAADLEALLKRGNADWQEVFFGVTPDFRRQLSQLPQRFADSKNFIDEVVQDIPKGGTGGTIQNIYLRSIGIWCNRAFETLTGECAARLKLDGLFEYACDYAAVPYPSRVSEGGDYWPVRLALETRNAA